MTADAGNVGNRIEVVGQDRSELGACCVQRDGARSRYPLGAHRLQRKVKNDFLAARMGGPRASRCVRSVRQECASHRGRQLDGPTVLAATVAEVVDDDGDCRGRPSRRQCRGATQHNGGNEGKSGSRWRSGRPPQQAVTPLCCAGSDARPWRSEPREPADHAAAQARWDPPARGWRSRPVPPAPHPA